MATLTKAKPSEWLGNGMGNTTAEWVVKGAEHIAVRKLGTRWAAIDTTKPAGNGAVAFADTKSQLLNKLDGLAA
jgi:hypothetical protein